MTLERNEDESTGRTEVKIQDILCQRKEMQLN